MALCRCGDRQWQDSRIGDGKKLSGGAEAMCYLLARALGPGKLSVVPFVYIYFKWLFLLNRLVGIVSARVLRVSRIFRAKMSDSAIAQMIGMENAERLFGY